MTEKIFEEVRNIIGEGKQEFRETKNVIVDKRQFSLRLPKRFALKARLEKQDEFVFVMHPKEETLEMLKEKKPKIIIYLEEKDGEKEGETRT
ncbi:MAG: hypothetical protein ABH849_03975 [Nanoarchaeota archaeon]